MRWQVWLWCWALALCGGCQRQQPQRAENVNAAVAQESETSGADKMSIKLTSEVFPAGGLIPAQYTCAGPNLSPPLAWTDVPAAAKSLALIADDPDAPRGTWVHWVVYNLPPATKELPAGVPAQATIMGGGRQGQNDFGQIGYGGPCPPSGTHRYYFKLYALNTQLNLPAGASKQDLLKAMYGHILDEGQLLGRFGQQ